MRSTSAFTLSKNNRKSISEILELELERTWMRVKSPKGKVSSPDCEVESGIEDDDEGVSCIDFGWFSMFSRQCVLMYNV